MKKLFICALAVGMFTACSQEETLSTQAPMQISFDGAFVENATRADLATDPSTTTETIDAFDVWGFMDNASGVVFEGEDVTGSKGNFSYLNTQYWFPGKTYYFAALAPMNSENAVVTVSKDASAEKFGLGTVKFTITDGDEDLLYAAATKTTPDPMTQDPGKVMFTFNHLLSKVKFTFKNGFTNPNTTLNVTAITMEVPEVGTINLNQEDWWSTNQWVLEGTSTATLKFGDAGTIAATGDQESADERLMLPTVGKTYKVTFTVALSYGEVEAASYNHTVELSGVDFEIGKAYDIIAEINDLNIDPEGAIYPIVFDVEEVKDWVDGEAPVGVGQNVATEAELIAALANGGDIYVNNDITVSSELAVAAETSVNLFLGENTLSISNATTGIENAGTLYIHNGTVKYNFTGTDVYEISAYKEKAAILNNKGILALNNVNVESNVWAVNTFGTWADNVTLQNQGVATVKTHIVGGEIKSSFSHTSGTHIYAIGVIDNALVTIDGGAKVSGDGAVYVNCGKVNVDDATLTASCTTNSTVCFYAAGAAVIDYTDKTTGTTFTAYQDSEIFGDILINGEKK